MKTMVVDIDGMSCEHCVRHVSEALEALQGVSKVAVSLDNGQAIVEVGESFDESTVAPAVDEAGYEVTALRET